MQIIISYCIICWYLSGNNSLEVCNLKVMICISSPWFNYCFLIQLILFTKAKYSIWPEKALTKENFLLLIPRNLFSSQVWKDLYSQVMTEFDKKFILMHKWNPHHLIDSIHSIKKWNIGKKQHKYDSYIKDSKVSKTYLSDKLDNHCENIYIL